MPNNHEYDLRAVLLRIIEEQAKNQSALGPPLTSTSVLDTAVEQLKIRHNAELQLALLTQWHELFRTGYLSPGLNLSNTNLPFFHITTQGLRALAQVSRDPSNPAGYLRHVHDTAVLGEVARSYLEEALHCYVAGLYKAGAVMVGGAAEGVILELRDSLVLKLASANLSQPKGLCDWKVKTVLGALKEFFDKQSSNFPNTLRDGYKGYWPAFTEQIRAARNDAGHPSSISQITPEIIHASLLIFPELARLANGLHGWINCMK